MTFTKNHCVKILKFFRGLGWRLPVCVDKRCENDTNREVTQWMPIPMAAERWEE